MQPGEKLIPFQLKDQDGNRRTSEQLSADHALLLVVFTCNHCPYAVASWPVLIDLQNRYANELQIVAINPNNNPDYPDDHFEKMKPYVQARGINFPYLFDADQSVARAYKAVCTPDPYLFRDGKLIYHGRLTDNWQHPEEVQEHSMELQIQAALGRAEAPRETFPSMGCSIKWVR